jgi:ATP-dependent Clp protease protease subunit
MDLIKDFQKFSVSNGISSNKLNSYQNYTNSIISPTIIEERQLNVATMDVFSRLMADRIIFLGTAIDSDVANIVTSQLMYLNSVDSESDIKLFINSPGGSCADGLAIYDVMNFVDPDISTYVMGTSASMGSILSSSGTKGKRYALPHSKVLIHQPMGGVPGGTQESDFAIAYEQIKNIKDTLYKILSENTGQPYERILKDADRDCWFTAQQALEYGLIDEVLNKNKNK